MDLALAREVNRQGQRNRAIPLTIDYVYIDTGTLSRRKRQFDFKRPLCCYIGRCMCGERGVPRPSNEELVAGTSCFINSSTEINQSLIHGDCSPERSCSIC